MARGRFISNSISTSKKFARLGKNDHRLMYLMLIPHVDVEGRHDADPRILNGQVYTLLGLTLEQVDAGLMDMHRVGLITLYRVQGERYLEITNFHEHNTVRRSEDGSPSREAPSVVPPITSGTACDTTPELLRSNSGVGPAQGQGEVQVQVQVQVQETHSSNSEIEPRPPQALAASPPRESHDPGLFLEVWNTNCGRLPTAQRLNAKRKGAIRALVKEHGPATALDLFRDATRAVASDDFWLTRQYGFDNLLAGGKVLQRAEQWRNAGHALNPGNARLAQTAASIARAIGGLDDQPN